MKKQIMKYLLLTAGGLLAFLIAHHAATASRGYEAIGGEGVFILLPILWWLIATMIKDTKNIKEDMQND